MASWATSKLIVSGQVPTCRVRRSFGSMSPNDDDLGERAIRFFTEPLPARGGRFAKRFQRGQTGPPATLTSREDAESWVRSHPMVPEGGSPIGLSGQLKVDFRLTSESLYWLLDLLSSTDQRTAESTLFALTVNRAGIAHDETAMSLATRYTITLPDGSVHERPINCYPVITDL
jgi:hypothetical protein